MGTVDVAFEAEQTYDAAQVEAIAEVAMAHLEVGEGELSVLFTDDAHIRPLNAAWRDKDKPTDVLSFSQIEGEAVPGAPLVLGDVIISLETAARQAAERGHELAHEVQILLVHGIVHLLGYDHETDEEAEAMESIEAAIHAKVAARA